MPFVIAAAEVYGDEAGESGSGRDVDKRLD